MQKTEILQEELETLGQFDTCSLSNIRLRSEGFVIGTAACRFPNLPPVLGYAVTVSRAYTDITAYGSPVNIAEEHPRVASEIRAAGQRIVDSCQSPEFSPETLLKIIGSNREGNKC